jgi:hypothetical protein
VRFAAFAAFLIVLPGIASAEPSPAQANGTVTITTPAVNYNGTYSSATPGLRQSRRTPST